MKKLIDISVYIIFMCLTACSSDEPKYPTANIDENSISLSVSGEGGKVSVSFSTNTSWIMEGPQNVIISPRSGSKGNNSVEITFPMSEDTKYVTTHKFYINTSSGENITFFDIEQDPAPYLECEEELMLEQNGQRNTMTIHANAQPMILTEASWLTVELEKASDESGMAYSFKAEATENFALEERKAKVILSIGNLKKR